MKVSSLVFAVAAMSSPALLADTVVLQAYLKASNTHAEDRFGQAVAASGDTVVVGAPEESGAAIGIDGDQTVRKAPNTVSSGAVYVFTRKGGKWSQQAYVKASSPHADSFGRAVAISGDTLVVGSSWDRPGTKDGLEKGVAYVFVRNGAVWTQQARLRPANPGIASDFANSVAISGDTIVVGGRHETVDQAGAAFVFTRTGTEWTQQAALAAVPPMSGDGFGASVTISADTVAVGAPREQIAREMKKGSPSARPFTSTGAVYVFVRDGQAWLQQAHLTVENYGKEKTFFGGSVAASGDILVVGDHADASGGTGPHASPKTPPRILTGSGTAYTPTGAAHLFTRTGKNWKQDAFIKAGVPEWANFAHSVAASDNRIVVGARNEGVGSGAPNASGVNPTTRTEPSGAAYEYTRSGGNWNPIAHLKPPNAVPGLRFGDAVAVSGDTVIVGAEFESGGATGINGNMKDQTARFSGAAYVFQIKP